MTDHDWRRLEPGDRVWWCGSPTNAAGVVLAISARSVLIVWDDAVREVLRVHQRWMLERAPREPGRAS